MATDKLVGHDDATGANNESGYFRFDKFTAVATGSITEFRIKAGASVNVRVALYSDNSGQPGTLLNSVAGTPVTSGWNTIAFPSTSIVSGTVYWLATITEGTGGTKYVSETGMGNWAYKAGAFGDSWPTFGWTVSDNYSHLVAGWGIKVLIPSSISQPVGYGTPKLISTIKPSSLVQQVAYGTPTVLTSALIIQPSSFVQSIVIGTPALRYPQTISPSSIVQPVAVGIPWLGIFGFIKPQSIIQQISIGSPTLLKYVWHVILDGQYATETPEVNRAYIIGRDQYGNPVYGTAVNMDEVALVGERLDFQQELAIPLTTQAADVAAAILSKMRITGEKGVILIPPNCGQELFDVVQISDTGANQSAVNFRVVGIRFEYSPKQARYRHKLILGAP
jgi:hypothetical protein